ncbi:lysine 2,3-aminomutase YodO family protein [Methanocaldococcus villosus KIN24-T80]|uniref:Lysine 2,3-aminomutase YodO family protein n=1 Tax=Methanocaldococcus villosus KIN24-T80 TaxID=1069083 RepID=N6VY31_9EURY|nr:KamA family radical SAM protein [Methanocaldococcus villosus]ENN96032.1 lysine 2,3-aminomutase YodO family protein [Methanocaldococcus villosus KIN24-T80]
MFSILPELKEIFSKDDIEEIRESLFKYLNEFEYKVRNEGIIKNEIDRWLSLKAIQVFKNFISKEYEKIAGFSTLELMIKAYKGEIKNEAFLEEIKHLLLAISGKAKYSEGFLGEKLKDKIIDFSKLSGREAGKKRSEFLDEVYRVMKDYIKKYPCGLDKEVIERRRENKRLLMEFFGIDEEDWNDYKWQFKNIIKGKKGLEILKEMKFIDFPKEDFEVIEMAIEKGIPFGITPYYLHLFDFDKAYKYDLPIRRQVIPTRHYVEVMASKEKEEFDFMGELDTTPIDLVTRRYVTIAIIKPFESCPQICVYCQRNWMVKNFDEKAFSGWDKVEKALEWFAEHDSMIEILITGGDPFSLSDKAIERILNRIEDMDHVVGVRFGTRTLLTVPMRITENLLDILENFNDNKRVLIVTHAESAYEITPEVKETVKKINKRGINVYNQHVFHKFVSRRFENVALRIALKRAGIIPYYTFYPKGKYEHKEYLIPIARLCQEIKEEARLLPGTFRTDEAIFNVPRMGKLHMRSFQDRELIALKEDGSRVYLMHPWEKGIYKTKLYTYEDYPIKDYLDSLKKIGENIEDYWTIWYYY